MNRSTTPHRDDDDDNDFYFMAHNPCAIDSFA